MTTEDVMRKGSAETVETTDDSGGKKPAVEAKVSSEGGKKAEVSADENAWRENVKAARERAESTQRVAEEAELRVTDLRNQLGAPGQDPKDRNAVLAQMEETSNSIKQLRAEAREAKAALDKLLEEGREKNYSEASESPENAQGKPNDQYYRDRFAKLNQQIQDSQRRVQLYNDQIRDINERITQNSRTGDNYYIGKLQEDLEDARHNLQDAQDAGEKARQDLDTLLEEARQAGVPPGVFR
ncbi:MAG TPA: hypothetical protein VLZ81_05535 [Blastocatellia bacterium]|nr:hypothetical protein [Blastocatellia bacterium]